MNCAVLLGDLVGSRKVAPDRVDQAMQALRTTSDSLSPITGPSHFTRFRGDGWQLVTQRPEMTLRIALALMATLVRDDHLTTRVAIGIGQIDTLPEGDLGAASGSAFLRSGQALDDMPARHTLMLAGAPAPAGHWLDGLLPLVEAVVARWSPPQAEAVALALVPGWSIQADLADQLGISRQAIHLRLKGAAFPAIAAALAAFETFDWGNAP